MNADEFRQRTRLEVTQRLLADDPVERITDLVCEWRDAAMRQAAIVGRLQQAKEIANAPR